MVEQKSWATVTQSIKTILGWKFWIQDPLHEPEVLPLFLAHLVARKGWAYYKHIMLITTLSFFVIGKCSIAKL